MEHQAEVCLALQNSNSIPTRGELAVPAPKKGLQYKRKQKPYIV